MSECELRKAEANVSDVASFGKQPDQWSSVLNLIQKVGALKLTGLSKILPTTSGCYSPHWSKRAEFAGLLDLALLVHLPM